MMKGEVHWLGILEPEAFRRFHGTGMWAGTGLGLVILALMAYHKASVQWMIVASFVFVVVALSEVIKDAAIWIEARAEKARTSS